ncbi:MAG: hypothetical protein B7Z08_10850 [Sphingomonadales bacterium 32-68-7]|nr:MAG: hypothetical protein B7Z08_10850 [Sphingomonadales bacterium 32-68-7]
MGMVLCLRGASSEQMAALRADPDAADAFLFDDAAYEAGEIVGFDKAWNSLHFMFTGNGAESDHPLSFFPNEPEQVGEQFAVRLGGVLVPAAPGPRGRDEPPESIPQPRALTQRCADSGSGMVGIIT